MEEERVRGNKPDWEDELDDISEDDGSSQDSHTGDKPKRHKDKNQMQTEGDGEDSEDNGTVISEDGESSEGEDKQKKGVEDKKVKLFEERYFEVDNEPPKLVVVQGPPRSGKTTLIRSLVRHFTKQSIADPKGPITVRTGKKQRATFIECPCDMSAMADLASIADVVLLTIDASIGFELHTFEFLSLLQIKGFPKCMGIMTHMDAYKDNKKLKKMKKFFKRRFDDESTPESKLFFTDGFKNRYYLHADINNISRFLSVILPRKTEWKKEHPHILVDRLELLSDGMLEDESLVDVALFGYARGSTFMKSHLANVVGLGRKNLDDFKSVDDPCPPLEKKVNGTTEAEYQVEAPADPDADDAPKKKKPNHTRTLELDQRLLYAPQSNVGVLSFDETGGYVTIPDKFVIFTKRDGEDSSHEQHEGVQMMRKLQQSKVKLDLAVDEDDIELVTGITLKHKELAKEFISFQSSLKQVSQVAEKAAKFEGITVANTKFVDLAAKIYDEDGSDNLSGIMDVAKYSPPELQTREWYIKNAKKRFITGIDALADNEVLNSNVEAEEPEYTEADKRRLLSKEQNRVNLGEYLRLRITRIKFKHFKNFAAKPLVVNFPGYQSDTMGFSMVRFKKHRFYKNLLKSFDPLIVSAGFHKYQSIPMLAKKDNNDRLRLLKYTPQHDYCMAVFYGPFLELNTGIAVFQSIDEGLKKFRVAGTGVVVSFSPHYDIKKKLKLVGEPFKVFKNTALVKNMFNSRLELAKFIGAKIKTVSGIRGQIKKPSKEGPEGSYRATFEDKLLISDLVSMSTWYSIPLEKFYNPVVSFDENLLMMTTWQLRKKFDLKTPRFRDTYAPIERVDKVYAPVMVSKRLQEALPFRSKDKIITQGLKQKIQKEERSLLKPLASDQEKQAVYLVQRLKLIKKEKDQKQSSKMAEKIQRRAAWETGMKKGLTEQVKKLRKQRFVKQGLKEKRRAEAD